MSLEQKTALVEFDDGEKHHIEYDELFPEEQSIVPENRAEKTVNDSLGASPRPAKRCRGEG